MKAHWLNCDESVLVTGTLDPVEARAHLALEAAKIIKAGKGRDGDVVDMYERAQELTAIPERGVIVPQHPEAEYRWIWYAKDNGRVRAVKFD